MHRRSFIRTVVASATTAALPAFALAANSLGVPASKSAESDDNSRYSDKFYPSIGGLPALPAINWAAIGAQAPQLLSTPSYLPQADVVVITWAEAEWAAMQHVFVQSDESMPYSDASTSKWSGWVKYSDNMPSTPSSDDWTYWGYYRLVSMNGRRVLLFKSNTHLDYPGEQYLADLIQRLCQQVQPSLILSIGTAGGCRLGDKLGTVNVVNAATMYEAGEPSSSWSTYSNAYSPAWNIVKSAGFSSLLFGIPASSGNLQTLASQFNKFYGTNYSLATLNADGLCTPSALPALNNLTSSGTPLLTASTFVTGNTSGDYANYAVIEMDDAVIAQTCQQNSVAFGSIRNVSDPAQNAALPATAQGNWGSAVYDVFGFYTSYNGALVSWAAIAGMAA
jgi:nucleoside phosphorylase